MQGTFGRAMLCVMSASPKARCRSATATPGTASPNRTPPVDGCAAPRRPARAAPAWRTTNLRNLAALADETGRTVVHHDQFGCGRSSHRPDAPVDSWTPQLFVDEYTALVEHLGLGEHHVLGQSWGACSGRRSRSASRSTCGRSRSATPPRRCSSGSTARPSSGRSCAGRAGRPHPPRGRRHRRRPRVPRRHAGLSTSATSAASSPCRRTSSTPRRRWSRSRRSTTP